nr:uncharacterized protein LOC110359322 [Columba livia]
MEQPRSHRRGQAGGQGSSPRASSSPPACRCRGFVVVAGLRFGLKALAHSHVLLEVASAAASPLQANKTLCDQKDPAILYPYVHPARSRGVLALDVLASCICCWPSAVLGQTGNTGLYLVLSCLAARPAGPGSSCPSVLACTGIAVPTVGQGLCFFPLKPHSSRLSPYACALQGKGDLRGHVVGSGSLRQEEVPSSPAWRHPSHHREPGRSPACVCPGPGWSLPGISRIPAASPPEGPVPHCQRWSPAHGCLAQPREPPRTLPAPLPFPAGRQGSARRALSAAPSTAPPAASVSPAVVLLPPGTCYALQARSG